MFQCLDQICLRPTLIAGGSDAATLLFCLPCERSNEVVTRIDQTRKKIQLIKDRS